MHPTYIPTIDAHTHVLHSGGLCVLQSGLFETTTSYHSIGIHPKESRILTAVETAQLELRLASPLCLAVGECGLDSRYDVTLQEQEAAFITQLKLAARYHKPIVLHCVNTWDRCRFLHSKYAPQQTLIYHGFSKASIVEQVLGYDQAMISIGTCILTSKPLQAAVMKIPVDRMFLETDDIAMDIEIVYEQVALLKSLPLPALKTQLYANFKRIFGHVELA